MTFADFEEPYENFGRLEKRKLQCQAENSYQLKNIFECPWLVEDKDRAARPDRANSDSQFSA